MTKPLKVGLRAGGKPPDELLWSVHYLTAARDEAMSFLTEDQYAHVVDGFAALAREPDTKARKDFGRDAFAETACGRIRPLAVTAGYNSDSKEETEMATAEISPGVQPTRRDNDTVALAITVIMDRIMQLPAADRADFWALVLELHTAVADEDRLAIGRAIREVLGGATGSVQKMDLDTDKKKPQGYKNWVKVVSKRVGDARKKAKLTQDQLAAKSGLPQSHISRIEGAKLSPSNATLEKIAAALNLPIDHFDFS